jgi:hypothetical protein
MMFLKETMLAILSCPSGKELDKLILCDYCL